MLNFSFEPDSSRGGGVSDVSNQTDKNSVQLSDPKVCGRNESPNLISRKVGAMFTLPLFTRRSNTGAGRSTVGSGFQKKKVSMISAHLVSVLNRTLNLRKSSFLPSHKPVDTEEPVHLWGLGVRLCVEYLSNKRFRCISNLQRLLLRHQLFLK